MDSIMDSWKGVHLDKVIKQWGYPIEDRNIAGRTLYVWSETQQWSMPATVNTTGYGSTIGNQTYINTYSTVTGGGVSNWTCTRILEVNKSNIVIDWQWSGNNCPFLEEMQYKNWRYRGS